jgi:hypothetical protein
MLLTAALWPAGLACSGDPAPDARAHGAVLVQEDCSIDDIGA